jgi:hypothetical protein
VHDGSRVCRHLTRTSCLSPHKNNVLVSLLACVAGAHWLLLRLFAE